MQDGVGGQDTALEENEKLRQSLFNLNKLFAEKFETVKLNAFVEAELERTRTRLADVETHLAEAEARLESTQAHARQLLLHISCPPGLKWEEVGAEWQGCCDEIANAGLEEALQCKTEFSEEEWRAFEIAGLCVDSCIRVSDKYLRPVVGAADINAAVCTDFRDMLEQLSGALRSLAEKESVIKEQEYKLNHVEELQEGLKKELALLKVEADAAKKLNAKLHGQLAEAQKTLSDAESRTEAALREADTARHEVEVQLAAAKAEIQTLNNVHTEPKVDLDESDAAQIPHVDMDEWSIKIASDRSTGIDKLRGMLLDFRAPQSKSALENDEIRDLLATVRCICVDKALADSSMEPSCAHWLPLPEYVYAWFGNRGAAIRNHGSSVAKSRVVADGECSRFLHRLVQLQRKHRELATFHTLLDSCESDEVSYYVHARRVLVGLNRSSQLSIEVSRSIAQKACALLIMRHAEDVHAEKIKFEMAQSLLSSESISTASGRVDSAALLAGLLAVYKEEKQQLRSMLEVLHNAGDNLQNYPAIHKVRAMLHSINPDASDYDVLAIYQRCSLARDSRISICEERGVEGKDAGDVLEESGPVVPFGLLWLAMQRHGFMVTRQRIGLQFQPDTLHEPETVARSSADALATWLIVKPNVRSLVKKAEGSAFECERLWAQHAAHLIQRVEKASKLRDGQLGMDLAFGLKRLLTSTFSALSMRMDTTFPPANIAPMMEELNVMANAVKQRDLLQDAAQMTLRNHHKGKTKQVKQTPSAQGARPPSSFHPSNSKDSSKGRPKVAPPPNLQKPIIVGAQERASNSHRPQSAMQ